jgi:hypothetical protein
MLDLTRRSLLAGAAATVVPLTLGFHYPFPSVAHVEKTATGYREMPLPWNPSI